jgi:DNA-binding transcriptional MerR regulator
MPEQLDLFGIAQTSEGPAAQEPPPVQRTLKPPPVVEQEPVSAPAREILKEEAIRIARSNVTVEIPRRRVEVREIAKPMPSADKPGPAATLEAVEAEPAPVKSPLNPEDASEEVVPSTPVPTSSNEPIVVIAVKKDEEPKTKSTRGRKSIREMSLEADAPEIPEDGILFSKQYYGIGEVAGMFKVNTSLLRYWESEFDILKPRKNGKGDRFFRPDDIKNLQVIHYLLRQKKFTIEGAKDYLRNNKKSKEKFEMIRQLEQLKRFLLEMKAGL